MSVGDQPLRIDAVAKVTGDAAYPGDRIPPDALHALVVFMVRRGGVLRLVGYGLADLFGSSLTV